MLARTILEKPVLIYEGFLEDKFIIEGQQETLAHFRRTLSRKIDEQRQQLAA